MNVILLSASVIALAIVLSALSKLLYHVRPKIGFAQVSIGGNTDSDGEAFQATITLFHDENPVIWRNKLLQAYELKEWRLKMQNERMLEVQEEAKKAFEEAKAQGKINVVKS